MSSVRIASPNSVINNLFIKIKMDDFWLRDKMFEILGCYDNITKEYIKECSKNAKSVQELLNKLSEVGFPADEALC